MQETLALAPAVPARDREEIGDLLHRYCYGIDAKDSDVFRTVFTEECDLVYPLLDGRTLSWRTNDEVTAYMAASHAPLRGSMHMLSNIVFLRFDGDTAATRSYYDARLVQHSGAAYAVIGHYDDELVRTSAGWRIARRRAVGLWDQRVPAPA